MRISCLIGAVIAVSLATVQIAEAKTKTVHHTAQQAAAQQQDDPTDSVAEAGEDVVNVVVNVGRTASRALGNVFSDSQ